MSLKVGILGGSFDPPHMGHLWLAIQAQEQFNLDWVYFLPCNDKAAKGWKKNVTSPEEHRLEMCRWAAAGHPTIGALSLEIDMGFEFTHQSIEHLLASTDWDILWFVGSDWDASSFKNYDNIKDHVTFIKVLRPPQTELDVEDELPFIQPISFNLSSSIIRARLRNRKTTEGLIPPLVHKFIEHEGVYRCKE